MQQRKIEIPSINWEELKEAGLPKKETRERLEQTIHSLVRAIFLDRTSYLSKNDQEKIKNTMDELEELKKQYPGLIGVIQNQFAREIKETAEPEGDSQTLFTRLRVLTGIAVNQGLLGEWTEGNLRGVPDGLKIAYLFSIRKPRGEGKWWFLPQNWGNEIHKRVALLLKDLSVRATQRWMTERGIPLEREKGDKPAETEQKTPVSIPTEPQKESVKEPEPETPPETPAEPQKEKKKATKSPQSQKGKDDKPASGRGSGRGGKKQLETKATEQEAEQQIEEATEATKSEQPEQPPQKDEKVNPRKNEPLTHRMEIPPLKKSGK